MEGKRGAGKVLEKGAKQTELTEVGLGKGEGEDSGGGPAPGKRSVMFRHQKDDDKVLPTSVSTHNVRKIFIQFLNW